ncbi:hypothetical protein ACJX0J_010785, partial [Zea mays]
PKMDLSVHLCGTQDRVRREHFLRASVSWYIGPIRLYLGFSWIKETRVGSKTVNDLNV